MLKYWFIKSKNKYLHGCADQDLVFKKKSHARVESMNSVCVYKECYY